jgi:hypothetical protein
VPAKLDEQVKRLGWRSILERQDTLAEQCVMTAMAWDGGKTFAFSHRERVDPDKSPWAAEWASRLAPAPRTAIYRALGGNDADGQPLVDPMTDTPVLRDEEGVLWLAAPQRLPASAPLAELILQDPIWIRTSDGVLYPAPRDSYFGISWGYPGSGPGSLALLVNALLDDITAQAPADINGAPPQLEKVLQKKWPAGTVLTREQLLGARAGTWKPELPRKGDED